VAVGLGLASSEVAGQPSQETANRPREETSQTRSTEITPLLDRAKAAATGGDFEKAIDALETALGQLRREAPLRLDPFVLVVRPAKGYGAYEPRTGTIFRRGETMYFYVEPKNVVIPTSGRGNKGVGFDVDAEILSENDEVLAKQQRIASPNFGSNPKGHDLFVNLNFHANGPRGTYKVRFIFHDRNSEKTASVTQPFTLK
jgi:hypothetical protein